MGTGSRVLILGATGRVGGRVLTQLLDRGVPVRAIVRSAGRLPSAAVGHPLLEVIEADLLALTTEQLARQLADCDTVVSCLGHRITMKGIFGPPRDLVARAVQDVQAAVAALAPDRSIRLVLMSSVSVHQPEHADTRRGAAERALLAAMRVVLPPARDNQRAADLLAHVGSGDRHLAWVVVRPDTLTEGDVAEYRVHDELVASVVRPDHTRMASVAHFMCELITDEATWQRWQGRMPVIVDAEPAR